MYEYKVIPAPEKGEKSRNVKTPEGKFALSIEAALNEMAASGWEYLRAETLPSAERRGFAGTVTNMRSLLVFRRPLDHETAQFQPRKMDIPAPAVPAPSVSAEGPPQGVRRTEPGFRGAGAQEGNPPRLAGAGKDDDR